ncbi:GerAB/ArcD/ProY family transporter [Bacillus velezensis]|nr:GerAB/ArcD/ProY family transporter [Bacillus velezensis]
MLILGSVYIAQAPLNAIARFSFILTPFFFADLSAAFIHAGKSRYHIHYADFSRNRKRHAYRGARNTCQHYRLSGGARDRALINCTVSQRYKILTISNILIILYYLYITLTCFVTISPEEIKMIPEPVLYLLKTVSFRIIERTDLLFLTFLFVTVFSTLANVFYLASTGIAKLFNQKITAGLFIRWPCSSSFCLFGPQAQIKRYSGWISFSAFPILCLCICFRCLWY